MKTIKVMRAGRPATAEELRCAVEGEPLPTISPESGKWSGTPRTADACFRINTESKTPFDELAGFAVELERETQSLSESYRRLFMAAAYVCHHNYKKDAPIGTREIALDDLREVLKSKIPTQ